MGQTITGLRPKTGHTAEDGALFAAEAELEAVDCPVCGILYAVPAALVRSAKKWRMDRSDGRGWSLCCPIGHVWGWTGPNAEQRLRQQLDEERDRRARIAAERDQLKAAERHQRAAKSRALTANRKLKQRIGAGVCPCCHRTFKQLARHMAGQHPDYTPEQEETT